jgi:tRNA (cmo5U34)-methyltransferase
MLEKMNEFFNKRLDGYDEHMMTNIESSDVFYPFTADCLPKNDGVKILDLGCGTGLELKHYFILNPSAKITGIDLTESMLNALKNKFPEKELTLICGSYFDVPFDENAFDAAVSVESLHHFTKEEKIPLYTKLFKALKDGVYFIITDYFALTDEDEQTFRNELLRLKKEQGIDDNEFYHYDTPLTVEHETEALLEAGFSSVEVLNNWEATFTIKANK